VDPESWSKRLEEEYDCDSEDYSDARYLQQEQVCDPLIWKYKREAIPSAVFKDEIPDLHRKFINDLRNLFGFGFFLQVFILARVTLEASLKEKMGIDVGQLGDNRERGMD